LSKEVHALNDKYLHWRNLLHFQFPLDSRRTHHIGAALKHIHNNTLRIVFSVLFFLLTLLACHSSFTTIASYSSGFFFFPFLMFRRVDLTFHVYKYVTLGFCFCFFFRSSTVLFFPCSAFFLSWSVLSCFPRHPTVIQCTTISFSCTALRVPTLYYICMPLPSVRSDFCFFYYRAIASWRVLRVWSYCSNLKISIMPAYELSSTKWEPRIEADHLRGLAKRMTIVLYFPGPWGQRTEKQELRQVICDHLG
jgi:hypothetical protein